MTSNKINEELFATKKLLNRYIEKRMIQWATWSIKGMTNHLGYPSCSCEAKLIKSKGIVVSDFDKGSSPLYNDSAEYMEDILSSLNEENHLWAISIVLRYTSKAIDIQLKELGINKNTYKKHLRLAKNWLAEKLISNIAF